MRPWERPSRPNCFPKGPQYVIVRLPQLRHPTAPPRLQTHARENPKKASTTAPKMTPTHSRGSPRTPREGPKRCLFKSTPSTMAPRRPHAPQKGARAKTP
eukprot:1331565-Pyramimonas_sp.AAC.1